jgi:hypothetical protein
MTMTATRPETEAGFLDAVIQLAHLCGWWTYHTHDSRHSAKGFPDLVLVRAPDAIFAELKSERGRVTAEQADVLARLALCGLETAVWRPSDWPTIERRLKARAER